MINTGSRAVSTAREISADGTTYVWMDVMPVNGNPPSDDFTGVSVILTQGQARALAESLLDSLSA
jgi:hypothetical protein